MSSAKQHGLGAANLAEHYDAFLYGAGDAKIGSIIHQNAQVGKKLKAKFLKQTPALKRLIETIQAKIKKQGYLKGLDGRLLHIRSSHAALNTLLQSAGAILVKKATILFHELAEAAGYRLGVDYAQVLHIHDEVQVEVYRPEIAEALGELAIEALKQAGEHFKFRCPITGEYKIGKNWKETH